MQFISYENPDGYLYCVKKDSVIHGVLLDCLACPLFRGTLQGLGRECVIGEDDEQPIIIHDPYEYIESKQISVGDL